MAIPYYIRMGDPMESPIGYVLHGVFHGNGAPHGIPHQDIGRFGSELVCIVEGERNHRMPGALKTNDDLEIQCGTAKTVNSDNGRSRGIFIPCIEA